MTNKSFVDYTGDGSTTIYTFSFPYLQTTHIQVKVNGVLKTVGTDYSFLSTGSIQFTVAPPVGQTIDIRRVTPRDSRTVDYQGGSSITESNLDNDMLQTFYILQEVMDTLGVS